MEKSENQAPFDMLFAFVEEPCWKSPWGPLFQGSFALPAIGEIMRGFHDNGVVAAAWFLDSDRAMREIDEIEALFDSLEPPLRGRWGFAHRVCPMMFAAAKGWDRALMALSKAQNFEPRPNQRVGPWGGLNVFSKALESAERADIARLLIRAGASPATIAEAADDLRELAAARVVEDPARAGLLGALSAMLRGELAAQAGGDSVPRAAGSKPSLRLVT